MCAVFFVDANIGRNAKFSEVYAVIEHYHVADYGGIVGGNRHISREAGICEGSEQVGDFL